MSTQIKTPCKWCGGKGLLPLTAHDQLECWHCDGAGVIQIREDVIQSRVRKIFIPGQRPFEIVDLPQRSLVTDTLIKRES